MDYDFPEIELRNENMQLSQRYHSLAKVHIDAHFLVEIPKREELKESARCIWSVYDIEIK